MGFKYLLCISLGMTVCSPLMANSSNSQLYKQIHQPDLNKNLIRDDIERFAQRAFKNPMEQQAVLQYAKSYQQQLISNQNQKTITSAQIKADGCLMQTFDYMGRLKTRQIRNYIQSKYATSAESKKRALVVHMNQKNLPWGSAPACSCEPMVDSKELRREKALIGKDVDGNGVRDYVDSYINKIGADSKNSTKFNAYAKSIQDLLFIDYRNVGAVLSQWDLMESLEEELLILDGSNKRRISKIQSLSLNTSSQIRAFKRAGRVVELSRGRSPKGNCSQ